MAMEIKTRGQIVQEVAEMLSAIDSTGNSILDNTTTPTLNRINTYIDDGIREIISTYAFKFTEKSCSYPFFHKIDDVQSLYLTGVANSGGGGIILNRTPWPAEALSIGCANPPVLDSQSYYSGIDFVGYSGVTPLSGVSTSGYLYSASINTLGYNYDLGNSLDKIIAITIPAKGYKLNYITQYDLDRYVPQGNTITSGVPIYYTDFPGLSSSGNIVIGFYPQPDATFSGVNFTCHYMKKHLNMTSNDTVQTIIPEQFQDIIVDKVLEKCYKQLGDDKYPFYAQQVVNRGLAMRKWAELNMDTTRRFIDADISSPVNYTTDINQSMAGMLGLI